MRGISWVRQNERDHHTGGTCHDRFSRIILRNDMVRGGDDMSYALTDDIENPMVVGDYYEEEDEGKFFTEEEDADFKRDMERDNALWEI